MILLVRLGHSCCGSHHDRDINASINLKDKTIRLLTAKTAEIPKYRSTKLTFHEYDVYPYDLFVNGDEKLKKPVVSFILLTNIIF